MPSFSKCFLPLCFLLISEVKAQEIITGFDHFSPIIEWKEESGLSVAPIHAGLLPNGKLFFVSVFNLENAPADLTAPGYLPSFFFTMEPSPAYSPSPASVMIQPISTPLPVGFVSNEQNNTVELKTLDCSGHALMADGNLLFASGSDGFIDLDLYASGNIVEGLIVDGLAESVTYNPFTNTWIQNPDLVGAGPLAGSPRRWYATVTRLADSSMLVTGGYENIYPEFSYNKSVELLDPASNSWSVVSALEDTPAGIENPDYTHVYQFPYAYTTEDPATNTVIDFNIVMMLGGSGEPLFLFLNGQDKFWLKTQNFRPGAKEHIDLSAPSKVFPNHGSSSSLLPMRLPEDSWGYSNGSLLVAGGDHETPMEGNIDVYDPLANAWRPSLSMEGRRHHSSTVILPDGRILILAGHAEGNDQIGYAQLVDPKSDFTLFRGVAQMPETRGYHTVSVLLPDGRVLIGGGNEGGEDAIERPDFRYYYPDYMFKPRPQIVFMEDTMNFTDAFSVILVPHETNVDEVTLMGLGSMTHSYDMGQRSVQLKVIDPDVTLKIISGELVQVGPEECTDNPALCVDAHIILAPASQELAPPGYYMLFILDENRVPSPGKIIKLA